MSKRTLIVAATVPELSRLAPVLALPVDAGQVATTESRGQIVDVFVTGVGMVATAARCAHRFARQPYDFALNVGVCGSFDPALAIGAVVHVIADRFAELGAEDGDRFLEAGELGLVGDDEFPFTGGKLYDDYRSHNPVIRALPRVHGITVNTVHGRDESIGPVRTRFSPGVESMEGAAFMYAALLAGVPFAQVRAVSNRVERRNRDAWNLPLAIDNLGRTTLAFLEEE